MTATRGESAIRRLWLHWASPIAAFGCLVLSLVNACGEGEECHPVTRALPLNADEQCFGAPVQPEGLMACYEDTGRKGVRHFCVVSPEGVPHQVTSSPNARFLSPTGWRTDADLTSRERQACEAVLGECED